MARLVKGRNRPSHPCRHLDGHRAVLGDSNDTLAGFRALKIIALMQRGYLVPHYCKTTDPAIELNNEAGDNNKNISKAQP